MTCIDSVGVKLLGDLVGGGATVVGFSGFIAELLNTGGGERSSAECALARLVRCLSFPGPDDIRQELRPSIGPQLGVADVPRPSVRRDLHQEMTRCVPSFYRPRRAALVACWGISGCSSDTTSDAGKMGGSMDKMDPGKVGGAIDKMDTGKMSGAMDRWTWAR